MTDLSNITINVHSSIRIAGSKILYFDVFQMKEEKHDADVIFITHEHFDHFDPSSIGNVKKEDTIIVAPESMRKKVISELSVDEEKCIFLQPNEKCEMNAVCIEAVLAYNKLKPFHPKKNAWLGYLVSMDDVLYYVSGDTDVTEEMKKLQCDVALIPIGGMFTMDKKQAADYILKLVPKAVIPTHYGEVAGKPEDGMGFKEIVEKGNPDIQVELKI